MDKPIYEIPVVGGTPDRESESRPVAGGEQQEFLRTPSVMPSVPMPSAPSYARDPARHAAHVAPTSTPAAEPVAAAAQLSAAAPAPVPAHAAGAAPVPAHPAGPAPAVPSAALAATAAPVLAASREPASALPAQPEAPGAPGPAAAARWPGAEGGPLEQAPPPVAPAVPVYVAERIGRSQADQDLIAALQDVLMNGASDLHVSANAAPMIRIDGGLRPVTGTERWSREKVSSALRSIMTPAQQQAFDHDLELDFAYTVSSNARFRVNVYQQRAAMGAAFRLIPTEIKQLHELGVPETVGRFATLARGLVLVTGPTGSGKSTTLAALIDLVNRTRADHIMTVEDPIEFLHANQRSLVNQREVGHDTHSFAAALKHVLRQDPDVILVGELRDLETISVALTAAETGHLVFATLHTQSAPQTIDRVIDVYPPHQQEQVRSQLASTLQGVVTQTLVKRASGRGRVVATEVLVATPAINNLIREGKTYQIGSAMQAGREQGMHTLDQHLAELVNSGQITAAAAYEKCQDPETLKRLIQRQDVTGTMAGAIDFGDSFSARVH